MREVIDNAGSVVNYYTYDPILGRFTSRDPIIGKFQEPMSLHKYLYCLNDPMNGIDPSGELLDLLIGTAIDMWDDVTDAGVCFKAKSWADEIIIEGASAWNAFTRGCLNGLYGPDDVSYDTKFAIGAVAGFAEMEIGLRLKKASLATAFSSTFTSAANAAASKKRDFWTLETGVKFFVSVGMAAFRDRVSESDIDPITLWTIGFFTNVATNAITQPKEPE